MGRDRKAGQPKPEPKSVRANATKGSRVNKAAAVAAAAKVEFCAMQAARLAEMEQIQMLSGAAAQASPVAHRPLGAVTPITLRNMEPR
ncbi:hypothetical protein MAPG_10831 [Magnaporthiopsis poae ATCC 64411]|uniref:Uncharacterized protein n=1 Tax=Magnaporthiopsis poae (strain ATCC 64411 / 73-15) TaxID=644358 RepID=A0A0C4EDM6_MAGP6|nr:hypothetical protein MAPG_10831 [Magnaporthiopsis poae ATCC 64411]